MTANWDQALAELSDAELADGLIAGAVGEGWSERAAVGLLVSHRHWLSRRALRQAVETTLGLDGELFAWVVWDRVNREGAGSSPSELRVLVLACSLGGVPGDRPLRDLISSLDSTDATRVLNAMSVACTGRTLTRTHELWW